MDKAYFNGGWMEEADHLNPDMVILVKKYIWISWKNQAKAE